MTKRIKSAYAKITIHYMVLILATILLIRLFPGFIEYLPVGTAERLFSSTGTLDIKAPAYSGHLEDQSLMAHALFFLICFLSALLLSIPVGTTYMATRRGKKWTSSLVRMIVILPVAVTGLVMIVQNSLALAFSLAGIVAGAGIRFRSNMREFTDTVFFLISIGIGLSAGIGAIGLALLMSGFFCYLFLTLHALEYGELPEKQNSRDSRESRETPEAASPDQLPPTD